VEVWYPAAEDGGGEVSYDTRDFVPESVRSLLTADIPAGYTFDGDRDVPASDEGPFPVVLFSHGFSGFRLQSTFLTSHLASHGFVVAAPDHPSRSLEGVLGGTADRDQTSSVDELLETLELVEAQSEEEGGLLEGTVDPEQVAALGHSAGGGTVFLAADDERIDGYVSMASGARGPEEDAEPTYADKPSFFMAGAIDAVVPPAESTRPAFEGAPSPSTFWEIEATGHNGFDDFCTFGNGTGVIGIAEQSGLGGLLESQPQLRALGEDGCIEPAAPVEQAFPIIRHGVTAWLRALFELDEEPVGMTADDLAVHELAVEVEEG
jgi:dienelactone hydrolase